MITNPGYKRRNKRTIKKRLDNKHFYRIENNTYLFYVCQQINGDLKIEMIDDMNCQRDSKR